MLVVSSPYFRIKFGGGIRWSKFPMPVLGMSSSLKRPLILDVSNLTVKR
jgi:hypothetical protein